MRIMGVLVFGFLPVMATGQMGDLFGTLAQAAGDAPLLPETNEARFKGLLLLTMIILLGLVGIFVVLGLMTAWRKGHRLQRRVENEISKRRGPQLQVDTWRIAGERTPGPIAATLPSAASGHDAEVLEDGNTELLDADPDINESSTATETTLDPRSESERDDLEGDESTLDTGEGDLETGATELTSESGPPRFDTGADYDDGYEDDDAEVDTGDHWKQGTDYDPELDDPESTDEMEDLDDEQDPFRRYRASEQDEFSDLDDPIEDDESP